MSEKLIKEKVKKVYEEVLPIVLNGVEDKYREELKDSYFDFVLRTYCRSLEKHCKKFDVDKCIETYIEIEQDSWKDKKQYEKLCLLIRDEYLTKIEEMHGKIIQAVNETVKTGNILTDEEGYRNFFRKSIEYLPKVRDFNKELAITLLEDAHYGIKCAYGKIGQGKS